MEPRRRDPDLQTETFVPRPFDKGSSCFFGGLRYISATFFESTLEETSPMNNTLVIGAIVVIVLLIAVWIFIRKGKS